MKLVIGGKSQGKKLYIAEKFGISPENITNEFSKACEQLVFEDFQDAVRTALAEGKSPEKLLDELLSVNPDIIILCDEVGCGVVPVAHEERVWRETVGRLCCKMAEQADSVERIFCGIPMRLK